MSKHSDGAVPRLIIQQLEPVGVDRQEVRP
jgi:hypothetical protein